MTMTKKRIIVAAIVLVVVAAAVVLLTSAGRKAHGTLPTTGTLTITEVDKDLGISELILSLDSNTAVTHYEVYIEGILLGERTPISDSLKTLSLLLSETQLLEVRFFAGAKDQKPLATALLYPSGQLGIYWPEDTIPVATVVYSIEVENGLLRCVLNRTPESAIDVDDFSLTMINGESQDLIIEGFSWDEADLTAELEFQPLSAGDSPKEVRIQLSFRGSVVTSAVFTVPASPTNSNPDDEADPGTDQNPDDETPPVNEDPSGNDKRPPSSGGSTGGTDPGEDENGEEVQVGDIVGSWKAEPVISGWSFISDFSITLEGLGNITHYELVVAGHQIDDRMPLTEPIRTVNILFSVPEDIVLRLYSGAEESEPALVVSCTIQGELIVTAID